MPRHKGRTSRKSVERDFPHIVEIAVPLGGLGKTVDAIYDFHSLHDIRAKHGRTRRDENGHNYMRWLFADPGTAVEFANKFGGTLGSTSERHSRTMAGKLGNQKLRKTRTASRTR
jgi:hypothetical protein